MSSILSPDESRTSENLVEPGKHKGNTFAKVFIYLLVLLLVAGGIIYTIRSKPELLGLSKPVINSQKEITGLVEKVGKIIKLPEGEVPTLATVTDLSKVQDRDFFKNAKEGDKVLVYETAKKAYLYRPSENKIIEVGVVSTNNQPQKQVAGDKTEIPVITATPLPSMPPTATTVPSPRPTLQQVKVTNTPTQMPTVTP